MLSKNEHFCGWHISQSWNVSTWINNWFLLHIPEEPGNCWNNVIGAPQASLQSGFAVLSAHLDIRVTTRSICWRPDIARGPSILEGAFCSASPPRDPERQAASRKIKSSGCAMHDARDGERYDRHASWERNIVESGRCVNFPHKQPGMWLTGVPLLSGDKWTVFTPSF